MEIEQRIIEEIDKLRPFLQNDGGNIEFVKYENGIVYVKLSGACAGCSLIDVTLKEGIEEILVNEIPEVKEVIKVD
jgi:Fe-S cluster biogenesis protein NfuA